MNASSEKMRTLSSLMHTSLIKMHTLSEKIGTLSSPERTLSSPTHTLRGKMHTHGSPTHTRTSQVGSWPLRAAMQMTVQSDSEYFSWKAPSRGSPPNEGIAEFCPAVAAEITPDQPESLQPTVCPTGLRCAPSLSCPLLLPRLPITAVLGIFITCQPLNANAQKPTLTGNKNPYTAIVYASLRPPPDRSHME
jgi:hypothetical protein